MIALADAQKTVSDVELLDMVRALRAPDTPPAGAPVASAARHPDEVGYGHGV
jgi:hypothetical protein